MREQMVAAQRAGIPAHLLLGDRDFTPEDYEMLCRLDERVENRKWVLATVFRSRGLWHVCGGAGSAVPSTHVCPRALRIP